MRPYLFGLLTIVLFGLGWYLNGAFKVNGLITLNLDTGSYDTVFGWHVLWKAWPLTLFLTLFVSLVGAAITIGLVSEAKKKATYTANQRVADRENELSQQASYLEEHKNAFLTERTTLRAKVTALESALSKLEQVVAEQESAMLKREQAVAEQESAVLNANATAQAKEHEAHNANGALIRLSKKKALGGPQKNALPPKAKPQTPKTNPPRLQESAPMVEQSDDPFPSPPTGGEAFNPLEQMEKEYQWMKRQQQKKDEQRRLRQMEWDEMK